ncbi:TPA: hypothetical protein DEP93_03880 [candidate division WWE3 bacterium]|uniref:Uncharacterized protein n=1 Tax=candidate division WWE3 bacterium TaxID=2053526 RepID=A0A3D0ZT37_UNCKA|nr:hypothetical protein [candidate division WWE3 bacterium]
MPDHRYQYLLSVLNSNNYEPTEETKKSHDEILKYVKSISELPEMNKLWEKELKELALSLEFYGEPIETITKLFKTYFDFEPKTNHFYVTRNWDKSGMCIPAKNAFYIIASWNSPKPNIRNIIHEIIHAYIDEIELPVSENIKATINNLPEEVFSNYKKAHTVVYESLVRALVVYLSRKDKDIEDQKFSEDDIALQLPEKYLQKLEADSPNIISKEYLSNLTI